ncbi:MAG TPA: cyclic nucleotide-binding domain-containing protein [Burkholderiales bacterium]|nr:cyclic nucleotide-binding domain-containing protein [Burkholderiales bacterium]
MNGADSGETRLPIEFVADGGVNPSPIAELLLKTELFSGFSRDETLRMAHYLQLYRSASGVAILREGDPGDYMMLLLQGRVNVLKLDHQKRQKIIGTVLPGQTFGEMSLVDGEPRFATCVTAEPTLYALLARETFARLISDDPRLGSKLLVELLETVSHRLREISETLVDFLRVK